MDQGGKAHVRKSPTIRECLGGEDHTGVREKTFHGYVSAGSKLGLLAAAGSIHFLFLLAACESKTDFLALDQSAIKTLTDNLRRPDADTELGQLIITQAIPLISILQVFIPLKIDDNVNCNHLPTADQWFEEIPFNDFKPAPRDYDMWSMGSTQYLSASQPKESIDVSAVNLRHLGEGGESLPAYEKRKLPRGPVETVQCGFNPTHPSNKKEWHPTESDKAKRQEEIARQTDIHREAASKNPKKPKTLVELRNALKSHYDADGVRFPESWIELMPSLFADKSLKIEVENSQPGTDPLILDVWGDTPPSLKDNLFRALNAAFSRRGEGLYYRNSKEDKGRKPFQAVHWVTYARSGTNGHDAPKDCHPSCMARGDKRINLHQIVPVESADIAQNRQEYKEVCDAYEDIFEWMKDTLEARHPDKFKILQITAEAIPHWRRSPVHPFTGYVVNLNVVSQVHRDDKDYQHFCGVLAIGDFAGGQLCLLEPGFIVDLRHCDWAFFLSDRFQYWTEMDEQKQSTTFPTLPPEILSEIFVQALPPEDSLTPYPSGDWFWSCRRTTVLAITHVCCYWREVAQSYSYLWSHIWIRLGTRHIIRGECDALRLALEKSKQTKLAVRIDEDIEGVSILQARNVLALLERRKDTIDTLYLHMDLPLMTLLPTPMPCVTHLVVESLRTGVGDDKTSAAETEGETPGAAETEGDLTGAILVKVLRCWQKEIDFYCERFLGEQDALFENGKKEAGQRLLALTRAQKELDALVVPTLDPWAGLDPKIHEWLAKMPYQARFVDSAVQDGFMVPSIKTIPRPSVPEGVSFYWRQIESQGGETTVSCVQRYHKSYTADTPWVIFTLLLLGQSMPRILSHLQAALPKKLQPIVSPLGQAIEGVARRLGRTSLLEADLGYAGETNRVHPWERVEEDAPLQTRYANFLRANDGHLHVRAFSIPGLRLPAAVDIKVNATASYREYALVALFRRRSLNSAHGGWARNAKIPQTIPAPGPPPFAAYQPQTSLSAALKRLFEDEHSWLRNHSSQVLEDNGFAEAVKNSCGVIRSPSPTFMPYLRYMKAVPLEEVKGRISGIWGADAGRALTEYRGLMSQLLGIELGGDVDLTTVAHFLGPSLDLWRWIIEHWWYWVHVLWTSRVLVRCQPILVMIWGGTNHRMIEDSHMEVVWTGIPEDLRRSINAGETPPRILDHLPRSAQKWYPIPRKTLTNVGTLIIRSSGPTSASPLHLFLLQLHPSAASYTPREAALHDLIIACVEGIALIAHRVIGKRLQKMDWPPYADKDVLWRWFLDLQNEIWAEVIGCGLGPALDTHKEELAALQATLAFCRRLEHDEDGEGEDGDEDDEEGDGEDADEEEGSVRLPSTSRAKAFEIPGLTMASRNADRPQQFALIVVQQQERLRGGGDSWERGFLIPEKFRQTPGTESHRSWFYGLAEGRRISAAAKTFGSSKDAKMNVRNNWDALGARSAAKKQQLQIGNALSLEQLDKALSKMAENRSLHADMQKDPRWAICDACHQVVVAVSAKGRHSCSEDTVGKKVKAVVNATEFPSLDRIVSFADIEAILDAMCSIDAHTEIFEAHDVHQQWSGDVLQTPLAKQVLQDLPAFSVLSSVEQSEFSTSAPQGTLEELLDGGDCILRKASVCPPRWQPTTANHRRAWAKKAENLALLSWVKKGCREFILC
ncbi:hypothetical protein DFH06DRAFT_1313219 [Mycena polygramma]|nr:hypothetical protein DFH06DRAFT_1313219 [Mycena polygramma]